MGLMIFTWFFMAALLVAALVARHHRRSHPDVDLRDPVRRGSMRMFWVHVDDPHKRGVTAAS